MDSIPIPDVGLLLRRDAISAGLSDSWLAHQVRTGGLVRVRHGVYARPDYARLRPHDQHRVRAQAVQQLYGDDVALSHISAALAWGAPDRGLPLDHVHLTHLDGDGERIRAGIKNHHGSLRVGDLTRNEFGWITTPGRSVVESLALLPRNAGVGLLDWVQQHHGVPREQLSAMLTTQDHWHSSRRSREWLDLSDGGAQSVGETLLRLQFHDLGLPQPRTQYPIADHRGHVFAWLDFGWEEHGVGAEFDGRMKYADSSGTIPDVDALIREKAREDRIREATGWLILRFTWDDLRRPELIAQRVRRAFGAAGRRNLG